MKEEKNSKKKNHKLNSKKVVINTKEDLNKLSISTLKNTKIFDFTGDYFDFIYQRALGLEKNPTEKESLLTSNSLLVNKNLNKKAPLKDVSKTAKIIKTAKKATKKITNISSNIQKKKEEKKNNTSTNINNYFSQDNYNSYNNSNIINNNNDISDYENQTLPLTSSNKYNNDIGMQPLARILKIDKIVFQMKYNTLPGEDLGVIGSIEELGMWDQNKALKLVWNSGNVWKTKINFNFSRTNSFEFKFIFISNGRVKQWEDGSNRKLIYEQLKEMVEPNIKEGYLVELKNVNGNNIIYNHKDNSLTVVCDWNKK